MSLARILAVTTVLMCCLAVSETQGRGRLLARRGVRSHSAPCHSCQVPASAPKSNEVCRNGVVLDFGFFCFYSCYICDESIDSLLFGSCGLTVDDMGDPCDHNPDGACEPVTFRKTRIEGVFIQDDYATDGVPIDAMPKAINGFRVADVKYDRSGTKYYARVYLHGKSKQAIAVPISEAKANKPVMGEAEPHSGMVDVLTAKLEDGTQIKCASVREKTK